MSISALRISIPFVLICSLGPAALAAPAAVPTLDLSTRAQLMRSVEGARHDFRTWPAANGATRPSLEAIAPEGLFEQRADEAIRKSAALAELWGRPIRGEQLQAELERMARQSRQPERLAAYFETLGNDAYLAAEVLARPVLADRLLREWYAADDRFHGDLERQARGAAALKPTLAALSSLGGSYREVEWTLELAAGRRTDDREPWEQRLSQVAALFGKEADQLAVGEVSPLQEERGRFYLVGLLELGQDHLRLALVEWHKVRFETWWNEARLDLPSHLVEPRKSYRLPTPAGESCADDTWKPTFNIPDARYEHTAVWTGAEMIVWGGLTSVGNFPEGGGRYDPATDSWTTVSPVGAPGVRAEHSAVWTGTEMIVFGGFGEDPADTGGRYNPVSDSWTPTSLAGAPAARWDHVAVWTGSEMIIWGGGSTLSSGGRYDPATDTWTPTSLANAPLGRDIATAVWTGTEMVVWGGFRDPVTLDTGGRYNPTTDSWQPTSLTGVPGFRHFHSAVWTGTEMIVWGGVGAGFGTVTGGRYDPASDSWQPTSTFGAPSARWLHEAIWTGSEMLIWGGTVLLADHPTSGGRYDPVSDSWQPMNLASAPEGREDAASIWTGDEMIVWGGLGDDSFVATGGRYHPATDSWIPTTTGGVPTARGLHTAAWTGAEMMIYGGNLLGEPGGLYDPATDSWRSVESSGSPTGIQNMTSVWTGSEVILWGGFPETNEGGRYNPLTNTWAPTSAVGAPIPRYWHSAVWTGSEMIVWGGWPTVNTGGRYDPTTDSWTPTSTLGAPSIRDSHVGLWTGSEMIIWGGFPETTAGENGSRYNPTSDSWTAMSSVGAPARRSRPSAVWTGSSMIIWGGQSHQDLTSYNSGGRYDPTTDSWQPTTITGAPSARVTPAVWSGDEMIVWGGDLQAPTGGRYNPLGDSWTSTSQVGAPHGRWNTTLVWTGEEMIAWGGIIETATGGLYCARLEGNQVPIARDDAFAMNTNGRLRLAPPGVLENDTDGNGDTLRARIVDPPLHGSFRFSGNGALRYRPNPGFSGVDQFTYVAHDGQAASPPATVTIEVSCQTDCLRSVTIVIDLLLDSTRSRIWVEDENGVPSSGATVHATWTLPSGATISQDGVTDGGGQATLEILEDAFGTYRITIDDIVKSGSTFDPVNSLLTHAATR